MIREVIFYKTCAGKSPIGEFLDALSAKDAQKAAWVIRVVEDMAVVPRQYFQKMVNTDDLWEIRVRAGKAIYRFLGFFDGTKVVVLSHAFQKKSQKTPRQAIRLAEERKKESGITSGDKNYE